jgi:hypothetical protein
MYGRCLFQLIIILQNQQLELQDRIYFIQTRVSLFSGY